MIDYKNMLVADEGLTHSAYKDTTGNVTVGVGFNMDSISARGLWIKASIPESFNAVYANKVSLSGDSVNKLLDICVAGCNADLLSLLPNLNSYPNYVQLALLNLMFNMGKPVLAQFNTFLNLIKENNYDGASNDLSNTKWSSELPQRSNRVCSLLKNNDSGYSACLTGASTDSTQST